jgi:hypothetical protein
MDNDALDSMDQFESTVIAILDRLCGLAPAAVQNGVGCGYPCCRRCILASHDADKDIERGFGMAACQRADFGEGFGHREFCVPGFETVIASAAKQSMQSIATAGLLRRFAPRNDE